LNLQLAKQKVVVEDAMYKLNSIDDAVDPVDMSVAETQLATAKAELAAAQRKLEILEAGPKKGIVSLAEVNLATALADWEQIKDGPDVVRAEVQLEEARLELEILKQESTIIDLVAPIDSTVIALNAAVGDRLSIETETSSPGTGSDSSEPRSEIDTFEEIFFGSTSSNTEEDGSLITIADLSQPQLEVSLDETDFRNVAVGYPVKVVFDAFPDEVFSGEIVQISPQLETVSNVQVIQTLIRLDETSYAKPNILPIGLFASVEVIAGEAAGVVLVSYEALVEVDPEKYVVFVIENDLPQMREVIVGLMDFTSVEIIDGLSAGEIVAIGYADTTGK
jgi:multidrug efflux pump subunit AcrA (membrane-fusion protein)